MSIAMPPSLAAKASVALEPSLKPEEENGTVLQINKLQSSNKISTYVFRE